MAVALGQFGEPGAVLGLLMALTAAQVVIGNFLDPYLMGSSLNLSPFAILVALAVWSQLWGVAGAILAVPITAVMVIVFSEFARDAPHRHPALEERPSLSPGSSPHGDA